MAVLQTFQPKQVFGIKGLPAETGIESELTQINPLISADNKH
jgi:hypothetical protein